MRDFLYLLYSSFSIILLISLIIKFFQNRDKDENHSTLKGPIGLPVVGYLPFLGTKPHKKFYDLSKKYGNVFKLRLGNMKVIVLNDFKSINEAFRKDQFLGRPPNVAFNVLMELQGFGTLSGREWREQKRFTLYQLRNLGFGKISMEDHIQNEMIGLCQQIEALNAKPVKIRSIFGSSTSSNLSALVFGKPFDFNDPNRVLLDSAIEHAIAKLGQASFITFFPLFAKFCAYFGLFGLKEVKHDFIVVNQYIRKEISEHKRTLDANNIRDYIDAFLLQIQKEQTKQANTSFTIDMLAGNVQGFFAAGTETVKTTIEWALLIMAGHQDIQIRVQKEIDDICGEHSPTWAQRSSMPLTQAVIKEIFRWKTISPLNLLRITTDNTSVENFNIKKDTIVIANLWAVHNDPENWKSPEIFDPDRFLTIDGKQVINFETLIPFSIGKRSCPGESLAQIELFLCLTSLLQKFKIFPTNTISYEEEVGLISQPKYPVVLRFEPRK